MTHFSLPIISKARKILTVHDIMYLTNPEYYDPKWKKINHYGYNILLPENIRKADQIIAISHYTKSELVSYFNLPEEKITVIHHGIKVADKVPGDSLKERLKRFNLGPGNYIYFPAGTFEFRKNIERTIEAFSNLSDKNGLTLVISGVGDPSPFLSASPCNDIRFVEWNSEAQKTAFFQGALFVVFPSLCEGFGVPVIEAMANGKAILTSNCAALGEVSGDAGMLVDPRRLDALHDGFEKLIEDETYRNELEKKGEQRIKKFSLDKMGREHFKVYESL